MNAFVWVKVPGSTANLGPGFDSLGLALPLFTTIEVRKSHKTRVYLKNDLLRGLPEDEENLVVQMIHHIFHARGELPPEVEVHMESEIPLTRGLGSSAAAIVAGLLAGNELLTHPFDSDDIFQIAAAMEGHPDNAAASLFGGFVATTFDGGRAYFQQLPVPPSLYVTVAVPSFQLPTVEARNVLPQQVERHDAVFNLSHTAYLVASLANGSLEGLRQGMNDRLHQPYRMPLVPGMQEIVQHGQEHGALGCVLSGAGPSVLALSEGEKPELASFMEGIFLNQGIEVTMYGFAPCQSGAEVKVVEGSQL